MSTHLFSHRSNLLADTQESSEFVDTFRRTHSTINVEADSIDSFDQQILDNLRNTLHDAWHEWKMIGL